MKDCLISVHLAENTRLPDYLRQIAQDLEEGRTSGTQTQGTWYIQVLDQTLPETLIDTLYSTGERFQWNLYYNQEHTPQYQVLADRGRHAVAFLTNGHWHGTTLNWHARRADLDGWDNFVQHMAPGWIFDIDPDRRQATLKSPSSKKITVPYTFEGFGELYAFYKENQPFNLRELL